MNPNSFFSEAFMNSPWFYLILAWSLVWKGLALWKSARKGDKYWFLGILVINTVGLLEILYLYVFSRGKKEEVSTIDGRIFQK